MARLQEACFPRLNQTADHKPVQVLAPKCLPQLGSGILHAGVEATRYTMVREKLQFLNGLEWQWSVDGDAMNVGARRELYEKTGRCVRDELWPRHGLINQRMAQTEAWARTDEQDF